MSAGGARRGFAARPGDAESWIKAPDASSRRGDEPSAFTARCAALAPGRSTPAPVHCGTWKNRFFSVFGPIRIGSNKTS